MATWVGGSGNDSWTGTSGADNADGSGGNDTIDGKDGNDVIYGGSGNDTLLGGLGDDALYGGTGDDLIIGGLGNDNMWGDAGNDTFRIEGSSSWDSFYGGADYDRIVVDNVPSYFNFTAIQITNLASDIEEIRNNSYNPAYIYAKGSLDLTNLQKFYKIDGVVGSDLADTIYGRAITNDGVAGSTLANIQGITIDGNAGNDTLFGSVLADTLNGGADTDKLKGLGGDDVLTGGTGTDTFIFSLGDGSDTVKDFTDGSDIIQFVGTSADDFTDLSIVAQFSNAVVSIDNIKVVLENVSISNLDGSDFLFS